MSKLIPLTALWRHTSSAGKTYYNGRLGEAKILMFPIESDNPNAPAFKIMLAEPDEATKQDYHDADRNQLDRDQPASTAQHPNIVDDDIPF